MKKSILKLVVLVILLVASVIAYFKINKKSEFKETNIEVALSLEDKIKDNSIWCGTFNLVWNDLKNDLAKQDIVFNPQLQVVENLNKGTFTTKYLDEDSYYKKYGRPTLELKREIEKAIKEKFNETSDILNDFDWNYSNPKDFFLYAMLKKEFKFNEKFDVLENDKFKDVENVKYFGINSDSKSNLRDQVKVLFYEHKDKFAIKIFTKSNDEIIIARGIEEENFLRIYNSIVSLSKGYKGNKEFTKNDMLIIPNIEYNVREELNELQNKNFTFNNGDVYFIKTAIQTIEFELNESGGKIKSESGIGANITALPEENEPRNFLVNDTFVIFLQEEGQELPYFASKVADIKKVQEIK